MKVENKFATLWYNKGKLRKGKSFFLFQTNMYQNGYGDIYFRLWRFHLLIYAHKLFGKIKLNKEYHKTIKF